MSGLRRYEKYTASNVEWLGEVPDHWGVGIGKRIFRQIREASKPDDEQLSATQRYGVVPQQLFMELEDQKVTLALTGLGNFKHVEKNDFVISLRSFQGGIEISRYVGCVSPAYTVLRAEGMIESKYWALLFKSEAYISVLQSATDGIREGKTISYEQFGQIPLPVPPIVEQRAIAAFLSGETSKIDALVQEQERLIALLKEKRQAVISHAVTKGLDRNVSMKDSGIEWFGEVPEHWAVKAFRYVGTVNEGQVNPQDSEHASKVLVAPDHIESGTGKLLAQITAVEQGAVSGKYEVLPGQVIYSKIRPALNKVCLSEGHWLCSADMYPITPAAGILTKWMCYFMLSHSFVEYVSVTSQRVAMPKVNREELNTVPFVIPPTDEQEMIIDVLDNETSQLATLISEAEHAIQLLKERRSALISAAVTGKIDVRKSVDEVVTT
ncbi:restriction endonuclease subunit S [Alicyclobacillus sp. ALC3]|uniref:restriction endonuclease subunit S n=1 Tax=Alicyclobacillus sp. ALC3 TaxID=2796143 RepID=UPI0023781931|nr:restriction endonuclease subunit S [Alicyclobacillus sp. ALC3]WDL99200.1 restriction endonuclease subunit S [Alicyclobacillus sp. ALC3]